MRYPAARKPRVGPYDMMEQPLAVCSAMQRASGGVSGRDIWEVTWLRRALISWLRPRVVKPDKRPRSGRPVGRVEGSIEGGRSAED